MVAGVAAAEFGVGGDGQVALGAGGGVPVGAVGHDRAEDGLTLPVGLVQGPVAGRELLLAGGGVVVAAVADGCGLGAGAQAGQAGLPGSAPTSTRSGQAARVYPACPAPFMTGTGCSGPLCIGRSSTGPTVTLATLPHLGQAPAPLLNEKRQPQKHATSLIIDTFLCARCDVAGW